MAKLTEDQKAFIVRELAMFRTPSEAAERVKEEFGVNVDRRQVHEYNPLASHKAPVAEKWRDLFHATREQFLRDQATIPIAHRSYRLRQLNDMERKAMQMGNLSLAAALLKQAAMEVGEMFTNRREFSGPRGAGNRYADLNEMTIEQIDAELRELLGVGVGNAV